LTFENMQQIISVNYTHAKVTYHHISKTNQQPSENLSIKLTFVSLYKTSFKILCLIQSKK